MSIVCAVLQLGVPCRTAEDGNADAGDFAVNQILGCIQLHSGGGACSDISPVDLIVDVVFETVVVETHLNLIGGIAQSGNVHIQAQVGIYLVEGDLVAVGEEAIGKGDHAICQSGSTAGVCIGIAGALCAAGNGSKCQIDRTILGTL